MARIFISHSSLNNAEALAVRDWLVKQGWADLFIDIDPVDGLVAAQRWQSALRSSLGQCRAVIFCLSPEWRDSENCISEFNEAMHVGAIPVGVMVKPIALERLPGELSLNWQIVDLTRGGLMETFTVAPPPDHLPVEVRFPREELQRLRGGLAKLGLVGFETSSFPWPPPDEPNRIPFRGLEPLVFQDAGVFFGRDSDLVRAREELLALRQQGSRRVFVILGASGAGKSSFLRAGLLPRMEREDRDFFTLPVVRPADAALTGRSGLAASLETAFESLRLPRSLGDLKSALMQDTNALPPILTELQQRASSRLVGHGQPQIDRPLTLLLAIDQAEEALTADRGDEAVRFLQHIAMAITRGPEMLVLMTIRSDRFELLQSAETLRDIPIYPFNLPPVRPAAFREAILGPASRASPPIELDVKLVDQLTADSAAQGADPLPLLAFALERLYLDFARATNKLSVENYHKLGGLEGVLNAALGEAFAHPKHPPAIPADPIERVRLLEAAFIPALVDINEANDEPLRRIAGEVEIPEAARGLISRLVEKRLLVRGLRSREDRSDDETTIEVAHEALLRRWSTLRQMLDHKAADLKAIQAVERATTNWNREGKKVEWLDHRGERLDRALSFMRDAGLARRLQGLPEAYLHECRKAEQAARQDREAQLIAREKSQRRARILLLSLVALAVAFLGAAIWQTRDATSREIRIFGSLATKAITEQFYQRAMRLSLQALPPVGALPFAERSAEVESLLARSARLSRVLVVLRGEGFAILSANYSTDGRMIITACDDKTARIWDAVSGNQIAVLKGHEDNLTGANFSSDDNYIVTSAVDKTARIWSMKTRREIATLRGHSDAVSSAEFSGSGKLVATASDDRSVRIWDAGTGKEIKRFDGHTNLVTSVAFSPDEKLLVTSSFDKTARIWDVESGQEKRVLTGHENYVLAARFSPDGKLIVTASEDNSVRMWDVDSGRQRSVFAGHERQVRDVKLSSDGSLIATASDDSTARIWDTITGETLYALRGLENGVRRIDFAPDRRAIAIVPGDLTAQIWELVSPREILVVKHQRQEIWGAEFDAQARRLVTASQDGSVRLYDAKTGRELRSFSGHGKSVYGATFHPEGNQLLTASEDETARIWEIASGREIHALSGHKSGVRSARYSADGQRIVTASDDKTIRVWDGRTGQQMAVINGHTSVVNYAEFSPNGKQIASASWDGTARLWDAETRSEVLRYVGHNGAVDTAKFSADGKRVVTASYDGTARLWEASTGREIAVLKGHFIGVWTAAFSPDGTKIVTASDDKTARLWDANTGAEIGILLGHAGVVRDAVFSPDSQYVVTASHDRSMRVWDARPDKLSAGIGLRDQICADKLIGAQQFSAAELSDPIFLGLKDINPCARQGPLSYRYWTELPSRMLTFSSPPRRN